MNFHKYKFLKSIISKLDWIFILKLKIIIIINKETSRIVPFFTAKNSNTECSMLTMNVI